MAERKMKPCIIVQGGGFSSELGELSATFSKAVNYSAKAGYEVLMQGGTAVDAVEKAVCVLEDDKNFNAGVGSWLNEKGEVECDAMIMDGHNMKTGAVMAARHFDHPISLARRVMEETPHCALDGDGALAFAQRRGFDIKKPEELVTSEAQTRDLSGLEYLGELVPKLTSPGICQEFDTVSAVAMDDNCQLACATSTGGIPGKMKGRVGDAPLVGCGGYANHFGASSTTGHGESLMKMTLAREAIYNIERGDDAQTAVEKALKRMEDDVQGRGGLIAIDRAGNIGKAFNTKVMVWSSIKDNEISYGIHQNECKTTST